MSGGYFRKALMIFGGSKYALNSKVVLNQS